MYQAMQAFSKTATCTNAYLLILHLHDFALGRRQPVHAGAAVRCLRHQGAGADFNVGAG